MEELEATRMVLLDFLIAYQARILALPQAFQGGLWERVVCLEVALSSATSMGELQVTHRDLHDLGGAIFAAQLRSQAKDRSQQPRNSLQPAAP